MGEALTYPIVAPNLTSDVEACVDAEFVACMVHACGSVMTGVKPSELFGFSPRGRRFNVSAERLQSLAQEASRIYAQGLEDAPVRLASLGTHNGRQMLLCWRPEALHTLIQDSETRVFLQRHGLDVTGPDALACSVVLRLERYYDAQATCCSCGQTDVGTAIDFPHEVGVLLGFPVRDVEGFIAHAGKGELACGHWKVYGDVDRAERAFARIARAKKRCALLSSKGYSVRGLIRDRQAGKLR